MYVCMYVRMYVCMYVRMYVCMYVSMYQQIGTWPASKQDLIIKHQKEFCAFVESIDFEDLKVGNQCT